MLTGFLFGFMVFTMYNAELTSYLTRYNPELTSYLTRYNSELTSYLTRYSPQGADPLTLPLHVGTAGKII
jgi:hypothetical protein